MARRSAKKTVIPTPEDEAAASRYLLPDSNTLAFPTYNFIRSMIRGAGGIKVGKRSVIPYLAGCVIPAEELASFNTEKYSVDTRRAVIQRQGVLRSRARLDKWKITFKLAVDVDNLPDGFAIEDLRGIVEEAGRRVGIGDFRPEKCGPFGRFKLTDFKIS